MSSSKSRPIASSSASHNSPSPRPHSTQTPSKAYLVVDTTLRFTLTPHEYRILHDYLVRRSPSKFLRRKAPSPSHFDDVSRRRNEYFAASIRNAGRLFLICLAGLEGWEFVKGRIAARARRGRAVTQQTTATRRTPFLSSPSFRLSASVSAILFLHRSLHRFFTRLRANLLTRDALPFRRRNPRISKLLVAKLTAAVVSSLSVFALGMYPGEPLRVTVAIWVVTKALEFAYNAVEMKGILGLGKDTRPWWFGSWMLMPFVCGQLLHAAVMERDCFPKSYGDFILDWSPRYVERRPTQYPAGKPWPKNDQVFEGFTSITKMNWPPFISPILFPSAKLSASLAPIAPVVSTAHPSITNLSCALLHPHDPSCLRTYISFFPQALLDFTKFWTVVYGLFSLPRYKAYLKDPAHELNKFAQKVFRSSMFLSGAIGTAWGSICLFQAYLPRKNIPSQRWFWGGFIGGMWAFVDRKNSRGNVMYSVRASLESVWKVGVKHGWWKSGKNLDLWILMMGMMLLNVIYESNPEAVSSGILKKGLALMRGDHSKEKERSRLKSISEERSKT
ncbi:hypothetical protein MMC25_004457 [Agyrium rufum]|nr:hypothetical protein [Agyrium rufum]